MPEQDLLDELIMLLSDLNEKIITYFDKQSSSLDEELEKLKQKEDKALVLQSKLDATEKLNTEYTKRIADLDRKNAAIEHSLSEKEKLIKELQDEIKLDKAQIGLEKEKAYKLQKNLTVNEESVKQEIGKREAANAAKVEAEELAHQYKRQYEELQTRLKEAPEQGVRDFFAKIDQDGYSLARLWNADAKSSEGAINAFREVLVRLGVQCKWGVGEEIEISSEEDLQRFRMRVSAPSLPFRARIISPGFTYRNRSICLPEIDLT